MYQAVCMVPLAVYGFQKEWVWIPGERAFFYHDFYVYIRQSWFWMELATIVAGSKRARST
jgi:hypothetical protein